MTLLTQPILEISLCLVSSVMLGYIAGWSMSKNILESRERAKMKEIQDLFNQEQEQIYKFKEELEDRDKKLGELKFTTALQEHELIEYKDKYREARERFEKSERIV